MQLEAYKTLARAEAAREYTHLKMKIHFKSSTLNLYYAGEQSRIEKENRLISLNFT